MHNYKVGDVVRVVASNYGHDFEIGSLVTVMTMKTSGYIDLCQSTETGEEWFMMDDEVEPVKEQTAFERVKVGDTIVALVDMRDNLNNVIKAGTQLIVGDKDEDDLRLITPYNKYGTWFYMATKRNVFNVYRPENQINGFDSFKIVRNEIETQEKTSVEKVSAKVSGEVVAKKGKFLYVVQDEEENTFTTTFDREYARDVKADLGGKKEGYKIVAYAPVKEIR